MFDPTFSVLDFVESPFGLSLGERDSEFLFPVQRFILKLMYNEPLDDNRESIRIPKTRDDNGSSDQEDVYTFTEREYLHYLTSENRASPSSNNGRPKEAVISLGRQSGKSTLTRISSLYDVYSLLENPNPWEDQGYDLDRGFSTPPTFQITVFQHNRTIVNNQTDDYWRCQDGCDFLSTRSTTSTRHSMYFQHSFVEKGNEHIRLRRMSTQSMCHKVRGSTSLYAYVDEAHSFSGKKFDALRASFRGEWSLTLMSTPPPLGEHKEETFFKERFNSAYEDPSKLALRIPTWEVNPLIPEEQYQKQYKQDKELYELEYGARFPSDIEG